MCITNLSQLNAAYLLNAGGCTSITAQLADLLKRQQRRCTLDTENSIVREGDGFEYRVCLNTLKVQGESVNILLNFTQFFETRIEYRFQI
ncbi:hypothetical protein, partial [Aeromonas caviae]